MSLLGEGGIKVTKRQEEDYSRILGAIRAQLEKDGFNIENEWYPDGYFVSNDHKMWHFRLKECPSWLFGVWVTDGNKMDDEYCSDEAYLLDVFAQPEMYIDKFKPTASEILGEHQIYKKDLRDFKEFHEWDLKWWTRVFRYVRDQPYLAWYRHEHYTDYNLEYISPEQAKKDFENAEKERLEYEEKQEKQYQEEYVYIKGILEKTGLKYKIIDENKNGYECIPRYHVVIEDPSVKTKGTYSFLDDNEEKKLKEIQKKYDCYEGFSSYATFVKNMPKGKK